MLYAVASTLVNCTNSYDHEEPDPQMVELAKYAKQHIPEQHPKVSRTQPMGRQWVRRTGILSWVSLGPSGKGGSRLAALS